MTTYIAPEDENGKRLVHKQLGCLAKHSLTMFDCREGPDTDDPETALYTAKQQARQDADMVELCKECW